MFVNPSVGDSVIHSDKDRQKQHKRRPMEGWIRKMGCIIHSRMLCSRKKKEILPFATIESREESRF